MLRRGELALDLGVAALQRRGLEAQPKARERGAELVRRVRHELALPAQRARHPAGHVVERGGHLPLLGGALHARARVEIAVRHATRRRGEAAHRLRQGAGEQPGHDEAEQQRQRAHARERDHVVALLVFTASTLWVTRTAPAARPFTATGTAVKRRSSSRRSLWRSPWVGRPWSARADLGAGAVAVAPRGLAGRVGQHPPAVVDHDHAAAEAPRRALHEPLELVGLVQPAGGAGRDQLRLGPGIVLDLGVHALRQVQRERHRERHDHEHEHVRERERRAACAGS